ncbi:hypothetical protein TNCV_1733271 [Trichonephila clavipes]|nr:hypothetical protein TNCV_1733271 [Trichonephila clavipes]
MHFKSVEAQSHPAGLVWYFGNGEGEYQLRYRLSTSSLDPGSELRVELGIESRPSGLESDALTTRLPTALLTLINDEILSRCRMRDMNFASET